MSRLRPCVPLAGEPRAPPAPGVRARGALPVPRVPVAHQAPPQHAAPRAHPPQGRRLRRCGAGATAGVRGGWSAGVRPPSEVPLMPMPLPPWPASPQQQQQLLARKLFACPSCGRGYTCAYTLRRHVRLECGKEAALQCPFCPRRTKHRHSLLRHLRQCHPLPPSSTPLQTPDFPCAYKGESF